MKKTVLYLAAVLLAVYACSEGSMDYSATNDASYEAGNNSDGSGTAGSLARFAISSDYLYTVDMSALKVYDLRNESKPIYEGEEYIDFGIETIFAKGNYLFLGSRQGVYIYSIANPSRPVQLSVFEHVYSCDPVVVKGNYAYSTLNSEGACGQGLNQLDVIDVSDPEYPVLVKTIPMLAPKGLGVSDSLLFVCDDGLKVYSLVEPDNPVFMKQLSIDAVDVIPLDTLLLVATTEGVEQYALDDSLQVHHLSSLYSY